MRASIKTRRRAPKLAAAFHALAEARMHEAAFDILRCRSARAEASATKSEPSARRGRRGLPEIWAQGDILLERVAPSGSPKVEAGNSSVTLFHGELSGHHHTVYGRVRFSRDAALARDVPSELYLGRLIVSAGPAVLKHQQHGAIALEEGTYRVRRQRYFEPTGAALVGD